MKKKLKKYKLYIAIGILALFTGVNIFLTIRLSELTTQQAKWNGFQEDIDDKVNEALMIITKKCI